MYVKDDALGTRIDEVLKSPHLNDWERSFCTSVKSFYIAHKNQVTPSQMATLQKVLDNHSPERQASENAWKASWTPEKADTFSKVVKYYSGTGYFRNTCDKAKGNANYIPSEKEYDKMVNNKYAQRYLKAVALPPKYIVGDLVISHNWWGWAVCMVTKVEELLRTNPSTRQYVLDDVGIRTAGFEAETAVAYNEEGNLRPLTEKNLNKYLYNK